MGIQTAFETVVRQRVDIRVPLHREVISTLLGRDEVLDQEPFLTRILPAESRDERC